MDYCTNCKDLPRYDGTGLCRLCIDTLAEGARREREAILADFLDKQANEFCQCFECSPSFGEVEEWLRAVCETDKDGNPPEKERE